MPDHGRAIVMNGAAPVALAVDAVDALVEIAQADMWKRARRNWRPSRRTPDRRVPAPHGGHVVKMSRYQNPAGRRLCSARAADAAAHRRRWAIHIGRPKRQPVRASQARGLRVAGQEYALPLDDVQEIVAAPSHLAHRAAFRGLGSGRRSLRDRLAAAPVVARPAGFRPQPRTGDRKRWSSPRCRANLVGLVVDGHARHLFRRRQARMDPIPEVLAARTGGESRIKAIYRGKETGGLISILSAEQLSETM